MVKYEIKKVLSGIGGRFALVILVIMVIVVSAIAICSVKFVNEEGISSTGIAAARNLRKVKSEWTGYLTEDIFAAVIQKNAEIEATPEAQSVDWHENDKAYAKKQGFLDIRDIINCALSKFREYDYYCIDAVSPDEAGRIYERRITNLKEWLASDEAKDRYSDRQKAFFLDQYQKLKTPLYYEDMDGWDAVLTYSSTVIMLCMLILGFLVCGIFSNEFQLKADAVFFSSEKGRRQGVRAKIAAGLALITVIYWIVVLLYSGIVLAVLGSGGGDCPIQAGFHGWKSFYNITCFQEYLLTIFGGYIGTLFILTAAMLVSAVTKSAIIAVTLPVAVLFLPTFIGELSSVSGVLGLLPDQLLQAGYVVSYFNSYEIGGRVVGALPILFVTYTVLFLVLVPVLYELYRES